MVAKKRGLGKGLDALLGIPANGASPGAGNREEQLRAIPVEMLQRSPYQPRIEFDKQALDDLASSIRAQGVVQPIVVRPLSDDRFEIIAGERRWRAAQLAGLADVPVVIRRVTDVEAMCLALIENIQRQDLNPLEEARGVSRLLDEFEMTHDMIAEALGKSRSTITNLLRLLDLNPPVKEMLEKGEIEMGHARALLTLGGEQQVEAARLIVKKGLSVRETEALVRKLQNRPPVARKTGNSQIDPNIRSLQENLTEKLGAAVVFRHKKTGKGTMEIHYNSLDELDGILSRIK